jgi:hypothetical protein
MQDDSKVAFFCGLGAGLGVGVLAVIVALMPAGSSRTPSPPDHQAEAEYYRQKYKAEKAHREQVQEAFAKRLYGGK